VGRLVGGKSAAVFVIAYERSRRRFRSNVTVKQIEALAGLAAVLKPWAGRRYGMSTVRSAGGSLRFQIVST
jgi:hypothetical protein